jgi:hypothetical protein
MSQRCYPLIPSHFYVLALYEFPLIMYRPAIHIPSTEYLLTYVVALFTLIVLNNYYLCAMVF